MVDIYKSPLRYPGGKASMYDFFKRVINLNFSTGCYYAEAFAGGAGLALELLLNEDVEEIYLNDVDRFIYCFWKSVVSYSDDLISLIEETEVSIEEWKKQREIFRSGSKNLSVVEAGFAAFYLNRCNRSGILNAGPIGGMEQRSKWKIDARFNKKKLIDRVKLISCYSDRIKLYNLDAKSFITRISKGNLAKNDNLLIYADPPYVLRGKELYSRFFSDNDHVGFAKYIQGQKRIKWVISYDDHELVHENYKGSKKNIFELNYFANKVKVGKEVLISSPDCRLPDKYLQYSKDKVLSESNSSEVDNTSLGGLRKVSG